MRLLMIPWPHPGQKMCIRDRLSLENYNYVASDHGKAMKDVLEYFYNLEHKKVAIVTEGKSNSVVQTVRSTAFNEFMSERKEEKLDYSYIRINQNESSSDIKLLFNEPVSYTHLTRNLIGLWRKMGHLSKPLKWRGI